MYFFYQKRFNFESGKYSLYEKGGFHVLTRKTSYLLKNAFADKKIQVHYFL